MRANPEFHRTLYLRAQAPATPAVAEPVWLQLGPTIGMLCKQSNKVDYFRSQVG